MNKNFTIGSRQVGADAPVFIVAEMSANHLQDYNRALEILHAAKEAGADAIKLQTFTPDTITPVSYTHLIHFFLQMFCRQTAYRLAGIIKTI